MLWVYGHYILFYSFSSGIDFSRKKLTATDGPRAERVKIVMCAPNVNYQQNPLFIKSYMIINILNLNVLEAFMLWK